MRYYELFSESEPASGSVIKPRKPLTPAQAIKRNDRYVKVQQGIRDEQTKSAMRLNKLRAKAQEL
jgi:hypothetical protein